MYGRSETHFNLDGSGTHRFNFGGSDGLRIPGTATRLGLVLSQTGTDSTAVLKVFRGQPASDSPRESYPDASNDFPFWRSVRFASNRPELGESMTYISQRPEIYGYPEDPLHDGVGARMSLVGDGNISASHISSGSAANETVLQADGSGGSAFLTVVVHGDNIVDNTIPTAKYGNETVTAGKMSSGSATDRHVATADGAGGVDYEAVGGVTHVEGGATYNNNVITVSTAETVRGGDGILFAVPSPFGTSSTQTIQLAIDGQANSTHPLHDRNGDALHEDDLTVNSVYIAISDADSWDILVLPAGTGSGLALSNETPIAVAATGSPGTGNDASRNDHGHAGVQLSDTAPVTAGGTATGAAGDGTTASRHNHRHALGFGSAIQPVGAFSSAGTSNLAPRSNHAHQGVASLACAGDGVTCSAATGAVTITGAGDGVVTSGSVDDTTLTLVRDGLTDVVITGLPSGGAGGGDGVAGVITYTRTLIGSSSTSFTNNPLPINLNDALEDGQLIQFIVSNNTRTRVFGSVHVTSDSILDLTQQTATPTSVSAGLPVKIGNDATALGTFGHDSVYIYYADGAVHTGQTVSADIYVSGGRNDVIRQVDIYRLDAAVTVDIPGPGDQASDNSIAAAVNIWDETSIAVPTTGTWGFVNFGSIGDGVLWSMVPVPAG